MRALHALIAGCLSACACAAAHPGPIRVVTLSTVLTEIAREVGGDRVSVVGLVRPGVDPHTFGPSPADIRAVVDADVVLASGLGLEAYLDRLVASSGSRARVLSVGDLLPSLITTASAPGRTEIDPHWWHSIGNMVFAVGLVRAELTRARPEGGDYFLANANAYARGLLELKTWALLEVAALAPERRQLVTSHDAFGYLARDYGFTVRPISGLSTESEPDARHLAQLIDLIRRDAIPAVFAEDSVNPRLVENLVRETGVHLGGTLYADGLGPAGSGAESYDAMFRHNLSTIVGALGAR